MSSNQPTSSSMAVCNQCQVILISRVQLKVQNYFYFYTCQIRKSRKLSNIYFVFLIRNDKILKLLVSIVKEMNCFLILLNTVLFFCQERSEALLLKIMHFISFSGQHTKQCCGSYRAGFVPLTNGSGSGSCYFRHWPLRRLQKTGFFFLVFLFITF